MSIRNHNNKWLWLSLILTLIVLSTRAQDPYFDHYTEDFELPSNQVFSIVQDENNILYMATDRGLVRFDGYTFQTLTLRDGLKDNCILRINKDILNKRLWLTSLKNTCNYIEGGEIFTAPFNESLKQVESHEHYVQQVFVTTENEIFINFNDPGLFRVDKDSSLVKTSDHYDIVKGANICIFKNGNRYYWDQILNPEVDPNGKTSVKVVDNKFFISTTLVEKTSHNRKEIIVLPDDQFIFSYHRRLFYFKGNKLHEEIILDKEVLSLLYDDSTGDIWVGLDKGGGACRFQYGSILDEPKKYLEGKSITTILRDHEGNYWFSSKEEGVFRANSLDIPVYSFNSVSPGDNRITAMVSSGSVLYFGTYNGKLHKLIKTPDRQEKYSTSPVGNLQSTGIIRRLKLTSKGTLLIFSDYLTEVNTDGDLVGFKEFEAFLYDFHELNTDTWLFSFSPGILQYKNRTDQSIYDSDKWLFKVRNMFEDSGGTLWLSSQPYGVFTWTPGSKPEEAALLQEFQPDRSLAFEEIQGNMLFAPAGKGIVLLTADSLMHITQDDDGLCSDIVSNLLVEGDSIIWAGTSSGLNKIILNNDLKTIDNIEHLDTRNGLPSNRIYCLESFDGNIWAGTGKGLVMIPEIDIRPHNLVKPVIEYMTVNDRDTILLPSVTTLSKSHPFDFKFKFKTISYHKPHSVFYHFYMYPTDKGWSSAKDMEVRYPGLDHGEYTLYVKAMTTQKIDEDGIPDNLDNFSVLKITIPKKIHERLAFKIIVFCLVILAITLIILLIVKSLKNRERIKQRLLEAEKKALLSQMNPHFIFNSLNSIQHYIIQEDAENANLYLAKFAQLIRRILENSKKRQISLREEIETLMLYLNLEKLRFEDNFEFELIKSKDLDQNEIMIPPMLTQPFVENAIWHGLMPLSGKGLLKINFKRMGDLLKISVVDNGVGRVKASQRKRITGHTPTGLKNVNERIALLNKLEHGNISCQIIDLYNPDGTPAGTSVELIISILNDDK